MWQMRSGPHARQFHTVMMMMPLAQTLATQVILQSSPIGSGKTCFCWYVSRPFSHLSLSPSLYTVLFFQTTLSTKKTNRAGRQAEFPKLLLYPEGLRTRARRDTARHTLWIFLSFPLRAEKQNRHQTYGARERERGPCSKAVLYCNPGKQWALRRPYCSPHAGRTHCEQAMNHRTPWWRSSSSFHILSPACVAKNGPSGPRLGQVHQHALHRFQGGKHRLPSCLLILGAIQNMCLSKKAGEVRRVLRHESSVKSWDNSPCSQSGCGV